MRFYGSYTPLVHQVRYLFHSILIGGQSTAGKFVPNRVPKRFYHQYQDVLEDDILLLTECLVIFHLATTKDVLGIVRGGSRYAFTFANLTIHPKVLIRPSSRISMKALFRLRLLSALTSTIGHLGQRISPPTIVLNVEIVRLFPGTRPSEVAFLKGAGN